MSKVKKKKSNVAYLPFAKKQIIGRNHKASSILKTLEKRKNNLKGVIIIGITKQDDMWFQSSFGKACQTIALLERVKMNYLDNWAIGDIISGKYSKE